MVCFEDFMQLIFSGFLVLSLGMRFWSISESYPNTKYGKMVESCCIVALPNAPIAGFILINVFTLFG